MHQGKADPTIIEVLYKKDFIQTEALGQAFSTKPANSHVNGPVEQKRVSAAEVCINPYSKRHIQHNFGQRENPLMCCFPRHCSATGILQAKQAEAKNNSSLCNSYPFLATNLVF